MITKHQLITALQECPDNAQVFFCVPHPESVEDFLTAYLAQVEYAHDEDCTPFIRVYLESEKGL
jgi:hypothetical protein